MKRNRLCLSALREAVTVAQHSHEAVPHNDGHRIEPMSHLVPPFGTIWQQDNHRKNSGLAGVPRTRLYSSRDSANGIGSMAV